MTPPSKLTHLFTLVSRRNTKQLVAKAVILFIVAAATMLGLEAGLSDPQPELDASGPAGWLIDLPGFGKQIDFELAGHPLSADLVDDGTWADDDLRISAMLLVDFVFIYAYVLGLALILSGLAVRMFPAFPRVGRFYARTVLLAFAAGGADAIENAGLLSLVARRNQWFAAELAQWMATTKFFLLFTIALLVLAGLVFAAKGAATGDRGQSAS